MSASLLSPEEQCLLQKAIERSMETSSGLLRFGDIYDYIVRKRREPPGCNVVQWCRTAHVLTVPSDLRIAPSSSDQDIAPHRAAFVLGHGEGPGVDLKRWSQKLPRRVLTGEIVDALRFTDIVRYRKIGVQVGYFDALAAVQMSLDSPLHDKTVLLYLEALEEYLMAIGIEFKVELVDWQEQLATRYANEREYKAMGLVSFGIPVILGAAYSLVTQTPFPTTELLAIGTGLEFLRRIRNERKPPPLRRLLLGTTVTPPAAASH